MFLDNDHIAFIPYGVTVYYHSHKTNIQFHWHVFSVFLLKTLLKRSKKERKDITRKKDIMRKKESIIMMKKKNLLIWKTFKRPVLASCYIWYKDSALRKHMATMKHRLCLPESSLSKTSSRKRSTYLRKTWKRL